MSTFRDYITSAQRIGDEACLRTKRAQAVAYLAEKWRGRTDCTHVYRNAAGERIELSRKTLKRV